MENRHGNCARNSNDNQTRNISKKCYSLPTLQRENEKLKQDLNVLQAAHDEKEIRLSESLRKVELLEKENLELKEKVELKDASTNVTIETVDVSTSSIEISDVSSSSIDTSSAWSIETRNEPTSLPSVAYVDSDIQGEKRAALPFGEIFRELPYDEKNEIIMFDRNMKEPKFSCDVEKHFKKIGGKNTSKVVNNILNAIATKNLQKKFVWDGAADNSFQRMTNILACVYSVVCSEEISHHKVNNIIQNTLKS